MINNLKALCLVAVFTMFASIQVSAGEVSDAINDAAVKLVQQLPMDKKFALKSVSPEKSGVSEVYLRRLVNETEAALLTASNFKILLQNRYTTEEIWSEAIEFGEANFDDLYKSSKADFLIFISPRILESDVEINIQVMELTGQGSGRAIASTGYFNLGVNLKEVIGAGYDFLAEKVQVEIRKELKDFDQQIALLSLIRKGTPDDASLDRRLVKLIQDKKALLIAINQTYKVKVAIEENLDIPLSQSVFIPLKVPYFASQVGADFGSLLPSGSLTEGYLILTPGIDGTGEFELNFEFTQQPNGIAAKHAKLKLGKEELHELASAIRKMDNWERLAREKKINRYFSKPVICFPQADECIKNGVGFWFTIRKNIPNAEYSRDIVFRKGNAAFSYSFESSTFEIIVEYLKFMDRQGIFTFMGQLVDNSDILFK